MRVLARYAVPVLVAAGLGLAIFAAARPPDPDPVRTRRRLAEELRGRLERQITEVVLEERKFEAEMVRVEDECRQVAVERVGVEQSFEKAVGVRYGEWDAFRLASESKADLAAETWLMENEIEGIEKERRDLRSELEALRLERGTSTPERAAEIDARLGAQERVLAGLDDALKAARDDLALARTVLQAR